MALMRNKINWPKHRHIIDRFMDKIEPEPNSGCWLWTAAVSRLGYGTFRGESVYDPERKAHRHSWKLFRGRIPDGLHVLHKCDVRCCVNPDHLWLGTQGDNVRDCFRKGRTMSPRTRTYLKKIGAIT